MEEMKTDTLKVSGERFPVVSDFSLLDNEGSSVGF